MLVSLCEVVTFHLFEDILERDITKTELFDNWRTCFSFDNIRKRNVTQSYFQWDELDTNILSWDMICLFEGIFEHNICYKGTLWTIMNLIYDFTCLRSGTTKAFWTSIRCRRVYTTAILILRHARKTIIRGRSDLLITISKQPRQHKLSTHHNALQQPPHHPGIHQTLPDTSLTTASSLNPWSADS